MLQTTDFRTMERGEVPDPGAEVQGRSTACDAQLLRDLADTLHAMSQPITVLLCTFEYIASLDSVEEVRPLLVTGRQASERLRETALTMRAHLQAALKGG